MYKLESRPGWSKLMGALVEDEIRPQRTVQFTQTVDLTSVDRIRQQARALGKQPPSYTAFVVTAVSRTLEQNPWALQRLASTPFGRRLQRFEQVDIAVAAERNVEGSPCVTMLDILRDVPSQSIDEVTDWLRDLATNASNQQWQDFQKVASLPWPLPRLVIALPRWIPSLWVKYRGGAVLVSSPTRVGVDSVVTTWPYPLGVSFGFAKKRPVVVNDEVTARLTFDLVLAFDRRLMAGAQGARFFMELVQNLEDAQALAPEMDLPTEMSA